MRRIAALPPWLVRRRRSSRSRATAARRSGRRLPCCPPRRRAAPQPKGVPAAVAVELVHNFSLLHDDIMDRDVERRHRPTGWVVFGEGQAILAGNAMLTARGRRARPRRRRRAALPAQPADRGRGPDRRAVGGSRSEQPRATSTSTKCSRWRPARRPRCWPARPRSGPGRGRRRERGRRPGRLRPRTRHGVPARRRHPRHHRRPCCDRQVVVVRRPGRQAQRAHRGRAALRAQPRRRSSQDARRWSARVRRRRDRTRRSSSTRPAASSWAAQEADRRLALALAHLQTTCRRDGSNVRPRGAGSRTSSNVIVSRGGRTS